MEIRNNNMRRIKVCAGWDSTQNITDRLLRQFRSTINNDIEFVFDNSYDIIVYNNYITESPKNGSDSILFFHEPSWSGNHQKIFDINNNTLVYGYNFQTYHNCNRFIESSSHMFYGGAGSWREGNEFWIFNNLFNKTFIKNKTISCIMSNIGLNPNERAQGSIYFDRLNCVKALFNNLSDKIDFYGSSVNNHLSLKKDGLVEYKFSICIENTNENNYISEKFYDAILTDTIPIYFGCKNIKTIWPQKGYVLLKSITDINYVLQELLYIIDNGTDIYRENIEGCRIIKNQFLTQNNLYQKILEYSYK